LEQALVKGARGRKIRDWITGESDFGKEHEGVLGGLLGLMRFDLGGGFL
jgi:hypothetical protein